MSSYFHAPNNFYSTIDNVTTTFITFQDTMSDQDNIQVSRPCAGTVQQCRRTNNMSGIHWPNSNSSESINSDQRFDQASSTNSLDTGF